MKFRFLLFLLVFSLGSLFAENSIVYHSTSAVTFADALIRSGVSVIDINRSSDDSRFGRKFYVAADSVTAMRESTTDGVFIRFYLSDSAILLDLCDTTIARNYNYVQGMGRAEARALTDTWNLDGFDAIRYPSEKNAGGISYAVMNVNILTPIDVIK